MQFAFQGSDVVLFNPLSELRGSSNRNYRKENAPCGKKTDDSAVATSGERMHSLMGPRKG
ncbi:uncharacterized protein METZ01_LOCUS427611 [marine metagenome]|uniref:Uncharacterized protein n=1 Tax=marine metagenome TaxID=408172 RepID=A0A382XUE6_9ZZZZ